MISLLLTSSLFSFWCKEFLSNTLIILLIVYILGNSKHLITRGIYTYFMTDILCWESQISNVKHTLFVLYTTISLFIFKFNIQLWKKLSYIIDFNLSSDSYQTGFKPRVHCNWKLQLTIQTCLWGKKTLWNENML